MATIDFNRFRDPMIFLVRTPRCKKNSKLAQRSMERYLAETSDKQEKWLRHVQSILRKTFPFLEVSRDLTNLPIPEGIEVILTRTCFYRGLVVPGLIYAFNFTLPRQDVLGYELLSHMPFDYRIKDHLYAKTAGRFDLELFKHAEPLTYQI